MKFTERQMDEMKELIRVLDSVVNMAKANFPRNTDVRVETCESGGGASASVTLPWHRLSTLLDAGRAALEEGKRE